MYSHEIKEFLTARNNYIGGDDLLKVISIRENPQLREIIYNKETGWYYMKDDKGNEFNFESMLYKEAVKKNLVKEKILHK